MPQGKVSIPKDDFKQGLVDYANAAAKVNLYAYSITQQAMPALTYPPTDYADFTTKFEPAKAHCMDWTNGIFPTILSFPKTIATQTNNLYNLENTVAGLCLQILQNDPSNVSAKNGLNSALTNMQTIIQQQITTADTLVDSLNTFSTNISSDASSLSLIATNAFNDASGDQVEITKLNSDIDKLNSDINLYQSFLTVAQVGTIVSLFVGLIGFACCIIPGTQGIGGTLLIAGILGEGAPIAGWVILQNDINTAYNQIASDQGQVATYDQDIILLQGITKSFQSLVTANQEAQNALKTIIAMWQLLDNDIQTVKNNLTTAETDVSGDQYLLAQADLNTANVDWQEVVAFATALAGIDYKWQDSNGNWHSYSAEQPQPNSSAITQLGQAA